MLETLSYREREILGLVAEGVSNREIGELLFLSEKTVKTHLASIFRKLGVANRTEAATFYVRASSSSGEALLERLAAAAAELQHAINKLTALVVEVAGTR